MILLVDNYDSFTYNLVNQLECLGQQVDVVYNDVNPAYLNLDNYQGLVLSPGPCLPNDSNNLKEIIACAEGRLPVLGICLGMQALIEYFGGSLLKMSVPCHGKVDLVECTGEGLFLGLNGQQQIVRYHSWIADILPDFFSVTSKSKCGECMAVESRSRQVFGFQFHPESILTTNGKDMLRNWLRIVNIIPSY